MDGHTTRTASFVLSSSQRTEEKRRRINQKQSEIAKGKKEEGTHLLIEKRRARLKPIFVHTNASQIY